VLNVIEGEAINKGGAPDSIRGVTGAFADKVFEIFVPSDLFEIHPREMYYTIVKGVRAGKSKATIAAELKASL